MKTRNYIVSENEELKAEKIQLQSSTIQAQDSVIKLQGELLKCKDDKLQEPRGIDCCTKGCAADNEKKDSDVVVQPIG